MGFLDKLPGVDISLFTFDLGDKSYNKLVGAFIFLLAIMNCRNSF